MAITNKEILEEIEFLKKKMPNGEFALLKKSVEDLHGGQETLRSSIRELKKQLLDPDDGVVVKVNRNTEFRKNTQKVLWSLWIAILGIIGKMIFWD